MLLMLLATSPLLPLLGYLLATSLLLPLLGYLALLPISSS